MKTPATVQSLNRIPVELPRLRAVIGSIAEMLLQAKIAGEMNDKKRWLFLCNLILSLDRYNVEALIERGQARYEVGDEQGALEDANFAIELIDEFIEEYKQERRLSGPAADQEASEAAQQEYPSYAYAYYGRSQARGALGDVEGEIEDATIGLRLKPDNPEPFYRRYGHAYRILKDYDTALVWFTRALELNPALHTTYFSRSRLYMDMGKPELALQDLDTVISMQPTWDWPWLTRGVLYIQFERYDDAIGDLSQAIRLMEGIEGAEKWLAVSYINRARAWLAKAEKSQNRASLLDAAISDASLAITAVPENADAYHWRAVAYEQRGNVMRAEQDREHAKRLNPGKYS